MGHVVQPPCRSRVTYSRLHRTVSRWVLNISREEESTTSLGSLFQCSITLKVKKTHRGSAPLSEVRQKLSPSCILALWLEPRFEQSRNTVKMEAWFLHLACHSELLMLAQRGFISPAFPWHQHLCAQLCSPLNGLVHPLCSTEPLLSNPSLCILAKMHSCSRIPSHGPKLTAGHRQSKRGAWRPQKLAPVLEGEGGRRGMGKQ